MQAEVGQILDGKVTGVTKFGAFVDLQGGLTGMVHISEVSDTFVKEIADFVKVGDEVRVKILSIGEDKKISLSMKQANPDYGKPKPKKEFARKKPEELTSGSFCFFIIDFVFHKVEKILRTRARSGRPIHKGAIRNVKESRKLGVSHF